MINKPQQQSTPSLLQAVPDSQASLAWEEPTPPCPRPQEADPEGQQAPCLLAWDWVGTWEAEAEMAGQKGPGIYNNLLPGFLPAGLPVGRGCFSFLKATWPKCRAPRGPPMALGVTSIPPPPCFSGLGTSHGSLLSLALGAPLPCLVPLHSALIVTQGTLVTLSSMSPLECAICVLWCPDLTEHGGSMWSQEALESLSHQGKCGDITRR